MPAAITQLVTKDGNGAPRSISALDLSGTGAGPFLPLHGLVDKNGNQIDAANPLQVAGPVTDAQLRATPLPVSLTEIEIKNDSGNPLPVADAGVGAVADAAWGGSGSGSVVAVLKALWAALTGSPKVSPASGTFTSRTVTTVAATSTQLMAANANRKKWVIQAPASADVWINPLGGNAGVGLTDCFKIPAGAAMASDEFVTTSAITYYCATGSLILAAVEA